MSLAPRLKWKKSLIFVRKCSAEHLSQSAVNTRAVDFACSNCRPDVSAKGQIVGIQRQGGRWGLFFDDVCGMNGDKAPNFFLLHYIRNDWTVANLTLIPHFAVPSFGPSRRKPLAATCKTCRLGRVFDRSFADSQGRKNKEVVPLAVSLCQNTMVRARVSAAKLPLKKIAAPNSWMELWTC